MPLGAIVRAMKTFKNILLVLNPRETSDSEVTRALTFASDSNAKITLAAVVDAAPNNPRLVDMIVDKQEQLAPLAQIVEAVDVKVEIRVFVGRAFSEIILDVINNHRDLVIKPVEPRKAGYKLFAGTDFKLLRKCPCPLLLVQDKAHHRFKSIVAAIDVDANNPENEPLSGEILSLSNYIAARDASNYHVIHAWQLEHEDFLRSPRTGLSYLELEQLRKSEVERRNAQITSWVGKHCAERPVTAEATAPAVHLRNGPARIEIPNCLSAIEADLVVMGTVGRTGIPGFFIGNTAEDILNQVHCSVLALKPAGFVSPVVAGEDDAKASVQLRSVN